MVRCMSAKRFILLCLLFTGSLFIFYFSLFLFQLNAPVKAEYWVHDVYSYKEFKAKGISGKKIIVMAGSNGLFGINSEMIGSKTGYPVVNLSAHASIDLDFMYYKLKGVMGRGDVVVMPLEYTYYARNDKTTSFMSNNVMCWGDDYLFQLPLGRFMRFFIDAEPARVLKGVITRLESGGQNPKVKTDQEIIDSLHQIWDEEGVKWRGYSYTSLNRNGDFNVDKYIDKKMVGNYLRGRLNISSSFLKGYQKIEKLVRENSGQLYLVPPAMIRGQTFDLNRHEDRLKVEDLKSALLEHGITLYCNAALFTIDRAYFFDTHYHLNKYGALIRSENLGDCLKGLQENDSPLFSYEESIAKTILLEKKYKGFIKTPSTVF